MSGALRALAAREDAPIKPLDLYAGFGRGIEETANLIEIRLALAEYRARHGEDHWRIYDQPVGKC